MDKLIIVIKFCLQRGHGWPFFNCGDIKYVWHYVYCPFKCITPSMAFFSCIKQSYSLYSKLSIPWHAFITLSHYKAYKGNSKASLKAKNYHHICKTISHHYIHNISKDILKISETTSTHLTSHHYVNRVGLLNVITFFHRSLNFVNIS